MADNATILEMDLSQNDEELLRDTLNEWKEEVTANLLEEVEEIKEQKIEELEEADIEYREKMKEEFATKMLEALKEMREELRAEVISEMYDNNPELTILEKVKELIAPTLNEDYLGNMYAEEIETLGEKVRELEEDKSLEEGAKKLAELISPYSEKTQNILLSLIKEGGPDEITEQFYDLIENLEEADEDDDEEDDDIEDDDVDEDEDIDLDTYIKEDADAEGTEKKNSFINQIRSRI